MNFFVFVILTLAQILYAFILSQLVIPQWINPLNPGEADDYFSPAFLMRFGSQEHRQWEQNGIIIVFIVIFPFIGIHLVNTASTFVVRVRVLKISQLSTFIPQYLMDILFIPYKIRPGKGDVVETTHLLPSIPLQMPGPATNSLVLSVACHPHPNEVDTGMSLKLLQWGVVRRPRGNIGKSLTHSSNTLPTPYEVSGENLISFSPTLADPHSVLEKSEDITEQPTEPQRRESAFSIKRKALPTSFVRQVSESSSQEDIVFGHCTFSAEPVDELEPGRLYTGIRCDEDHTRWLWGKGEPDTEVG